MMDLTALGQGLDRRCLLGGCGALLASHAAPAPAPALPQEPGLLQLQLRPDFVTRVGAEVWINGRGPFVFVIDTGAGRTTLSDTLAARLSLPPAAPMLIHGVTQAIRAPGAVLARVQVASETYRDLTAPVLSRFNVGADGLLGLDVLSRFTLTFRRGQRAAELMPGGMIVSQGPSDETGTRLGRDWSRVARGRFGQLILGEQVVGGVDCAVFVDTGAEYSIGNLRLREAVQARATGGLENRRPVELHGASGPILRAEQAVVAAMTLDRQEMGRTPLLFADLHIFEALGLDGRPALLIGADLIGRFREATLDFRRNRISLVGHRPGGNGSGPVRSP